MTRIYQIWIIQALNVFLFYTHRIVVIKLSHLMNPNHFITLRQKLKELVFETVLEKHAFEDFYDKRELKHWE